MRKKNRQRTWWTARKWTLPLFSHFSRSELFRALQCDWWILTDRGRNTFTGLYSNIMLHEKKWRFYYYCNMRWEIPDHFEITLILLKVQNITKKCFVSLKMYVFTSSSSISSPAYPISSCTFTHALWINPQGLIKRFQLAVMNLDGYVSDPVLNR